ncbi:MAG TPA: hypothetical protein VK665_04365 [Candidatus Elarobacter sp.]|nr:hypothetical protein [Candidatus Elarobacter sp.]
MNVRLIVLTAALGSVALGTAASAQQPVGPNAMHLRSDRGSDRNIAVERRRLEQVIDMLQRDRRDYGGHREQAVDLLQRARQQLDEALEYDRSHPQG